MSNKIEIIERFRALGEDIALYGLALPEEADPALVEGYRAGRAKHGRYRCADRFVRKWIQFRRQALERGRGVSDDVTVDFLRRIDVPVCPITLVTLTHGERAETDWSIDRLNNNGAYAVGNLAVMSRGANSAKGARGLSEVWELSQGDSVVEGLTPQEWARMLATMYGPCIVEGKEPQWELRQVAPVPPDTFSFPRQVFQGLLARLAETPEPLPIFLESLPNNLLRTWTQRMLRMIRERSGELPAVTDVWFDDELFELFKKFFQFLCSCTDNHPLKVFERRPVHRQISQHMLDEMLLKSHGYIE